MSGFRPEENYGMQWECLDLTALALEIKEVRTLGKLKDPKTEDAARVVDITPAMAKWIVAQKSRSALRSKFVWVTVTGKPIDQSDFAREVWKPLHEAAKVKYRPPRQARHTFATRHIDRGTEPRWIAVQMGTSLKMLFETYTAQWNRARDRKAQETGNARGHVYGHGDQ